MNTARKLTSTDTHGSNMVALQVLRTAAMRYHTAIMTNALLRLARAATNKVHWHYSSTTPVTVNFVYIRHTSTTVVTRLLQASFCFVSTVVVCFVSVLGETAHAIIYTMWHSAVCCMCISFVAHTQNSLLVTVLLLLLLILLLGFNTVHTGAGCSCWLH
jgi:hypothetical protein